MGRGSDQARALGAEGLLYGPRQRQPLRPGQAKRKRRQDRQVSRQAYAANFEAAREHLAFGNGRVLAELLNHPASHGFKGLEKEQLRETITRGLTLYDQAADSDCEDADLMSSSEDIAGLVALYGRAAARGLPQRYLDMATNLAGYYAHALANRRAVERLQRDANQIGQLPEVIFGKDFADHLVRHGQILCGEERFQASSPGLGQGQSNPLETNVDCVRCLEIFQEDLNQDPDNLDHLTSAEWSAQLDEGDISRFGWADSRDLTRSQGSAAERAEILIDKHYRRTANEINGNLATFNSYRLPS